MTTLLSKEIETPVHSAAPSKSVVVQPLYGISIFLGAFLLFSVQLILGKYLLPWYGGTPALWTTCMFFFQALLLAGYAYAHAMVKCCSTRTQRAIHVPLIFAGLLWLAVMGFEWHRFLLPSNTFRTESNDHPALSVTILLSVSVGLPYLVLSSTGPLVQSWFAITCATRSPYRLYAISNLGSLLALLSYPVAVEPWLSLRSQAGIWSALFLFYAIAYTFCAWQATKTQFLRQDAEDALPPKTPTPTTRNYLFWTGLAACGSVMFLATTNQICQNVAV